MKDQSEKQSPKYLKLQDSSRNPSDTRNGSRMNVYPLKIDVKLDLDELRIWPDGGRTLHSILRMTEHYSQFLNSL